VYISSLNFLSDGSLQFEKLHLADMPDTRDIEVGTWMRNGRYVQISSVELDNPRSYYRTFQLGPLGWGTGLGAFSNDFTRGANRSSLIIISPCDHQ
jgi:hypothetical protein